MRKSATAGKRSGRGMRGVPVIVGVPYDENSSYLRGPAEAPPKIREALRCDASNMWSETGVDLGVEGRFADAGYLKLEGDGTFARIEDAVREQVEAGRRPLCLGGDHSVTYPILRGFGRKFGDLTIVHFDAHPDLYDEFEGSRVSHACPFSRVMEEKLVKRLIQIGIRTLNAHQAQQAKRFKVEMVTMQRMPAVAMLKKLRGPVYVSFDVDALDPAFAPGISHREPGGMSVREAIAHLHAIGGEIVGADLVEYNPRQDVGGMTATVCGKLLKEMLGKMVG